jgi:elongation factor G
MIEDRLGRVPGRHPAARSAPEGNLRASSTSSTSMNAVDLPTRTQGQKSNEGDDPGRASTDAADEYRADTARSCRRPSTTTCMERVLGDEEITTAEVKARAPQGHPGLQLSCRFSCGSAFKNKGVQPHARRRGRLPAHPARRPGRSRASDPKARRTRSWSARPSDDEPFAALAFKIVADPFVGKLTYFRVYSGTARQGRRRVLNARPRSATSASAASCTMHANQREDLDIGHRRRHRRGRRPQATSRTGDTLCDARRPDHPRDA